jgi:hypothetical protein
VIPTAPGGTDRTKRVDGLEGGKVIAPAQRYVSLDLLRAVAAIGVVFTHVYLLNGVPVLGNRHPTSLLADQGATGVWLFFVLSGFVISRPFVAGLVQGELPRIGKYARRRVFRILPLYWLSLLVVAVTTNSWATAPQGQAEQSIPGVEPCSRTAERHHHHRVVDAQPRSLLLRVRADPCMDADQMAASRHLRPLAGNRSAHHVDD